MFFGLTNSPATFQAMMNNLLRDLVVEEKVAVFIDDIMVATETEEMLWDALDINYFILFFLILLFFFFIFFFFGDDEKGT